MEFFELLGVARFDSSANFLRSWCYPYALVLHTMLPYCTPRGTGDLKYKKNLPDAGIYSLVRFVGSRLRLETSFSSGDKQAEALRIHPSHSSQGHKYLLLFVFLTYPPRVCILRGLPL